MTTTKQDLRGFYVTFQYGDRLFIGEVIGHVYDEATGCNRVRVKHFNGEMWKYPNEKRELMPPVRSIKVLGR